MSHKPSHLVEREKILRVIMGAAEELIPKTGIVLLAADFGEGGSLSYVSNVHREDTIKLLKEHIERLESRTDDTASTVES